MISSHDYLQDDERVICFLLDRIHPTADLTLVLVSPDNQIHRYWLVWDRFLMYRLRVRNSRACDTKKRDETMRNLGGTKETE